MGWFWNSKPAPETGDVVAGLQPDPSSEPSAATGVAVASTPSRNTEPTSSRQEQSDAALQELLREFYAEESRAQEKRIETRESAPRINAPSNPIPIDISPDTLYPTEMSCRSSFDYAMYCSSFGGQFVNVYRYGDFRSCSNHWNDFWLCMRTRNWEEQERVRAIREHYQRKAIKYRTGPSSEDVWEVRTEPVRDAMQGNLEELETRIENWKKANPWAVDPWKNPKALRDHKGGAGAD